MKRNGSRVPFFRSLVRTLHERRSASFKLADIPKSYRDQPFNLGTKLKTRAKLDVRVICSPTNIVIFLNHKHKQKPHATATV